MNCFISPENSKKDILMMKSTSNSSSFNTNESEYDVNVIKTLLMTKVPESCV